MVDTQGIADDAVDVDGWSYATDFGWLHMPPAAGSGKFRKVSPTDGANACLLHNLTAQPHCTTSLHNLTALYTLSLIVCTVLTAMVELQAYANMLRLFLCRYGTMSDGDAGFAAG